MATNPSATLRIEIADDHVRAAAARLAQVPQSPNSDAANPEHQDRAAGFGDELWGAWQDNVMVAALRVVVQPGCTATLSPPRSISGEPTATSAELIAAVLRQLHSRGIRLVQALVTLDHGPEADAFVAGGMRHLANLLYLVSLEQVFPDSPPAPLLTFAPRRTIRRLGSGGSSSGLIRARSTALA